MVGLFAVDFSAVAFLVCGTDLFDDPLDVGRGTGAHLRGLACERLELHRQRVPVATRGPPQVLDRPEEVLASVRVELGGVVDQRFQLDRERPGPALADLPAGDEPPGAGGGEPGLPACSRGCRCCPGPTLLVRVGDASRFTALDVPGSTLTKWPTTALASARLKFPRFAFTEPQPATVCTVPGSEKPPLSRSTGSRDEGVDSRSSEKSYERVLPL